MVRALASLKAVSMMHETVPKNIAMCNSRIIPCNAIIALGCISQCACRVASGSSVNACASHCP